MTWTRLDDGWTDKPELEDLDFADRWHYLAMIQFCSRVGRYDGVIRNVDARRCSDHPDPARALTNIASAGLIAVEGRAYRIVQIDEHVPPPSVRNSAEQAKVRQRRSRAHRSGDHSMCIFGSCPEAPRPDDVTGDVTSDVTGDIGTGRDGTGQAVYAVGTPATGERVTGWDVVAIPRELIA